VASVDTRQRGTRGTRAPLVRASHRLDAGLAVRVLRGADGIWEVVTPDGSERLRCNSLDHAQRLGRACAAQRSPCELIVHDAYHRVIARELVEGDPDASAVSDAAVRPERSGSRDPLQPASRSA
jgi:hypothetical protein